MANQISINQKKSNIRAYQYNVFCGDYIFYKEYYNYIITNDHSKVTATIIYRHI